MKKVYRITNTIRPNEISGKKKKPQYVLQFIEYVDGDQAEELVEVIKNSIPLSTGQIFRDALNMSFHKAEDTFEVNDYTTFDYARYIEFIKEICLGLSPEAIKFCFDLYDEFYNTGRVKNAYVPNMRVQMELDCSEDGCLVEYLYFDDYENLLVYDFYAAIKEKRAIKICKRCGTYFLTEKRTDQAYCSNECKNAVSKERSYIYYRSDQDLERLKRRIASRLQQRTKIMNEALKEDRISTHKAFLEEAKKWKKKVKNREKTYEEYRIWLEAQDKKYSFEPGIS